MGLVGSVDSKLVSVDGSCKVDVWFTIVIRVLAVSVVDSLSVVFEFGLGGEVGAVSVAVVVGTIGVSHVAVWVGLAVVVEVTPGMLIELEEVVIERGVLMVPGTTSADTE